MPRPRVTIGLIVRNGERHIVEAIETLCAQTYRDFELVVHDNASTDRTVERAEACAARDPRIRVRRRAENIGALGNLVAAAEAADTEYFCWAAHDDVREPGFLAALVDLLDRHPSAGLACCAVRNMLPDGTDAGLRPETSSLETTVGRSAAERVAVYLRDGPGTPFYGLYRTALLRESLPLLQHDCLLEGVPLLGLDVVFLADVVRRHDLAIVHEPLLRFRHGGWSHRMEVYGTPSKYARHVRGFVRGLHRASMDASFSTAERVRMRWALARYVWRCMTSPAMRRVSWHYLGLAVPVLRRVEGRWATLTEAPLVALRRRARALPRGAGVVLFGAGRHTRRRLDAIRAALGPARLVAIADDAGPMPSIDGVEIIPPSAIAAIRPAVVLVSSDTYEAAMYRRAEDVAPIDAQVWTIYDRTLESHATSASTSARNADMRSSASMS